MLNKSFSLLLSSDPSPPLTSVSATQSTSSRPSSSEPQLRSQLPSMVPSHGNLAPQMVASRLTSQTQGQTPSSQSRERMLTSSSRESGLMMPTSMPSRSTANGMAPHSTKRRLSEELTTLREMSSRTQLPGSSQASPHQATTPPSSSSTTRAPPPTTLASRLTSTCERYLVNTYSYSLNL